MNRLALGTVQFGMAYGIANRTGQVQLPEIQKILTAARDAKIDTLDTAIGYGSAEENLGDAGVEGWNVVSKLPEIPGDGAGGGPGSWAKLQVADALRRLRVRELYGVLFHRPRQLLEPQGREAHAALLDLKKSGVIQKVGISIYDPDDLAALLPLYDFDLVQLPMNLFDDRIQRAGLLSQLKAAGTEIHVRSVFLQGLLLLSASELPARFHRWRKEWELLDQYCASRKVSKISLCLGSVLRVSEVDRVLVGVETELQLKEIIEAARQVPDETYVPAGVLDRDLIDPRQWDRIELTKD